MADLYNSSSNIGPNLGVLTSEYNPVQPLSPFLAIKILDKIYDIDVNYISSFDMSRSIDSIGECEFTIIDTFDNSLEEKFMAMILAPGTNTVSVQYGWNEGDRSDWYTGIINDYKPSFTANNNLTITANCIMINKKTENVTKAYKTKNISDLIIQIANEEGWYIEDIDQADPLSEKREFIQTNCKAEDFIREKLLPEATFEGKRMSFFLNVDCDVAKIRFVAYDKYAAIPKKTYMLYAGNYGNVLSFDPAYNGSVVASTAQNIGFVDQITGEVSVYVANEEADKSTANAELQMFGATTPDKMRQLISNSWFSNNVASYKATLTTIGSTLVKPMDTIEILPIRPDGTVHHTGGVYYVETVSDSISGSYTTTYTLFKLPGGAQADMQSIVSEEGKV